MEEKQMQKKVKNETEKVIKNILEQGIKPDNIDYLYKLIDVHKDVANEEHWDGEEKEETGMRYSEGREGGYGDYSEDSYGRRRRDSRGRYMEGGNYGRRGVDAKYRGHDLIEDVYQNYGNYSEGREEYGRGNYGAKEDTMKSLEYMLQSVVEFITMLKDEAASQEEFEMIKKYTKKISEM